MSSLLSTRPRKPASAIPYAACRRSPVALITQDLSTGPGSPQLHFTILDFTCRLPAPWRPLLRQYCFTPVPAPPPSSRCGLKMRTRGIRRMQRHWLHQSHKRPWRTSSPLIRMLDPQGRGQYGDTSRMTALQCCHYHHRRWAHESRQCAAILGRSSDQEAGAQLFWAWGSKGCPLHISRTVSSLRASAGLWL